MNYKKENRFNPDFLAEMLSCLDDIEADDNAGAVVITGADPKFWSNGLDLEWMMMNVAEPGAVLEYLKSVNAMFRRWCLFPKPTVAALNGHTFAAGLFMAAYMDFRLMRQDRGWISLPEVNINIPLLPAMIGICRVTMSEAGFRKLYYTGGKFTAPEAVDFGFVEKAVPMDNLLTECIELAAMLAQKKTKTYGEMKRRLRGEIARLLDEEDPKYLEDTMKFALPGS